MGEDWGGTGGSREPLERDLTSGARLQRGSNGRVSVFTCLKVSERLGSELVGPTRGDSCDVGSCAQRGPVG